MLGGWPDAAPPSSFRRPGTPGCWSRPAFSSWNERGLAAAALKSIYRAANASAAAAVLGELNQAAMKRIWLALRNLTEN